MDPRERGTRRFFGLGRPLPRGSASWSAPTTRFGQIRGLLPQRRRPAVIVRLEPEDYLDRDHVVDRFARRIRHRPTGGTAGVREPRRPRPTAPQAGAAPLPPDDRDN